MTIYAKIENNAVIDYPLTEGAVRIALPQVSLPAEPDAFTPCVAGFGFVVVHPSPRPTTDHTWNVTEGTPEISGDGWVQAWLVEPATEQEIAERTEAQAAAVKRQRNRMLLDCDWTQLPDAPADRAAWAEYREALRQVKHQPGYPWAVQWPARPDAALIRARNTEGQYVGDDPTTPENEAWVEVTP